MNLASSASDDRYYLGPDFDAEWYAARYAPLLADRSEPMIHYLGHGRAAGCKPNRDVLANVIPRDPIAFTYQDLRNEIAIIEDAHVFDERWYAFCNDISVSETLQHYLVAGAYEGLDPNPFFSTKTYFDNNSEIARAGTNPLWHYVLYGFAEGRTGALNPRLLGSLAFDERIWAQGLTMD